MLDIVMDRGAVGSGALLKIFQIGKEDAEWISQNRIVSLDFRDKQIWSPLQAADILAYELYKMALRQFGGDEHPVRYPLKQLARNPKQVPPLWHYIDDDELKRVNAWLSR